MQNTVCGEMTLLLAGWFWSTATWSSLHSPIFHFIFAVMCEKELITYQINDV